MNDWFRFLMKAFMALVLTLSLTSCELIGDIFEAGAWTGGILVIVVIVGILWLLARLFGRGRR
ncbi:hypothetical protein DYU11_08550 [Fibrisoma montanum]|uniref:Phosphatidate cytidylyltransferase n=2 Tax=Fibrisoma montanum TaxID=2305895 RepID=A0A418MF13_9BACT|nr:hypothetical protein DYU11_08550 [Fibrisoma montanum]